MNEGTPQVSVIIVNYNTCQMTSECIDSIYQYTRGLSFELILVDNASVDRSKEFFLKDKRIKYIYSDQNLGFGKANNLGIRYAKGKYLFFLNSDTLLIENSILRLFEFMENYAVQYSLGACGCRLTDKDGTLIHSYGFFPTVSDIFSDTLNILKSILKRRKISREYFDFNKQGFKFVDYITGADLFIRKDVIERLEYVFDPAIFMYYEETDLQYRMENIGFKRCIIESTKIIHLEGKSVNNIVKKNYFKRYHLMILPSMVYYLKKNMSLREYITYLLFFRILILPRILVKNMAMLERIKLLILPFSKKKL